MTNTLPFLAQETGWHAQTLGQALGYMAIFALVGVLLLLISFKLFDRAITKIDLEAEIAKGNVAAAILAAGVLVSITVLIAMAML
jgi:uncharacterized membrane protein YjfL (UPF0719 family)